MDAERVFRSFYRKDRLFNQALPCTEGGARRDFYDEDPENLPDMIDGLEPISVFSEYWELHNPDYLDFVDGIIRRNPSPDLKGASAVIVMPAANELHVRRAINAVRKGLDPQKYPVILFHNWKTEPEKDVIEEAEKAGQLPNVHVFSQQVPEHFNVAAVKKTASDIALRLAGGRDIPFISVDADVTGTSPALAEKTAAKLRRHETLVCAAQPAFDQEALARFPVLSLINQLKKEMDEFAFSKKLFMNNISGSFVGIMPKTLAAIGGFKPATCFASGYEIVRYEDIRLSEDMKTLMTASYDGVFNFDDYVSQVKGGWVSLDPSRDILSLIQTGDINSRWKGDNYDAVSGTRRPITDPGSEYPGIPELGPMTSENLNTALNKFWQGSYGHPALSVFGNLLSCKTLELLASHGIKPDCALEYEGIPIGGAESPHEYVYEAALKLLKSRNGCNISRFIIRDGAEFPVFPNTPSLPHKA